MHVMEPELAVVCEVRDRSGRIWKQLPPELAQRIIDLLPRNEVACTIRLVNRAAAAQFRDPSYTTVLLSLPVPPHAFLRHWVGPDALRCLPLKQRRLLLRLTASSGCVANLELLVQRLGCPYTSHLLAAAASGRQRDACLWLLARGCRWSEAVPRAAAATGDAPFCAWLLDAGCPLDDKSLDVAAAAGHRAVCELLLARGCVWQPAAPRAAAAAGHVDLLDWLLDQQPAEDPASSFPSAAAAAVAIAEGVLPAAAAGCDLPTLQRLHAKLLAAIPEFDGGGAEAAAAAAGLRTHVRVHIVTCAIGSATPDWRAKMEWLLELGYPLAVDSWRAAASRPDWLARLEWLTAAPGLRLDVRAALAAARAGAADALAALLREHGVSLAGQQGVVASEAASGGHLGVLRLLYEQGFRREVCSMVLEPAAHAHPHVIKWLIETFGGLGEGDADDAGRGGGGRGAPESRFLMREAARGAAATGNLEMLVWLHARGCRFGERTFAVAAEWGSEEMLEWLAERGCRMGTQGQAYVTAARSGDLATLRCLRRLGCPWDPSGATFSRAVAQRCPLAVLRWLVEQGCPVNWVVAEREAAAHEALPPWREAADVLAWIRAQRRQGGLLRDGCQRAQLLPQVLGLTRRLAALSAGWRTLARGVAVRYCEYRGWEVPPAPDQDQDQED